MEIIATGTTTEKQKEGILGSFLIPESGDLDCGDVLLDEFEKHYELIRSKEGKMELMDLSSVLYEFIISEYFKPEKPIFFKGASLYFDRDSEFTTVFQKLEPLFFSKPLNRPKREVS